MAENGRNYSIEITDMGSMGEGIGHIEGMAVFVPGTVTGDIAMVEITQVKKSFARGQLLYIESPSEMRAAPACQFIDECGGCGFQFLNYEAQLAMKEKSVRDKLKRIGGFGEDELTIEPIIGAENQWRYRNKAVYSIGQDGSVGFKQRKSHRVRDCEDCMIQTRAANAAASALRTFLEENNVSVYDHKTGKGLLRNLVVRTSFATGEVMAVLVLNGKDFPELQTLVDMMYDAVDETTLDDGTQCELVSVAINVNKERTGEIFGQETMIVCGTSVITDYIGGLKFEISPTSFYQVNPEQLQKLYGKVSEYAGLTGEETVFDLYCGVGTIGLTLAEKAKAVWGIELVRDAVIDANRNAVINGIINARYVCGKSEEEMPLTNEGEEIRPDIIILDPPRSGCRGSLLDTVLTASPPRLIYVSCDPATLARDLKILCSDGAYRIDHICPVDMFPRTVHVETVCLLSNRKPDTKVRIDVDLEDYYRIKDAKKNQN